MTAAEIAQSVLRGEYSLSEVRCIDAACKLAIDDAARRQAFTLSVGDRVRVADDVRPLYLRGMIGTVSRFGDTRIMVRWDADCIDRAPFEHQRRLSGEWRMTQTSIERIAA